MLLLLSGIKCADLFKGSPTYTVWSCTSRIQVRCLSSDVQRARQRLFFSRRVLRRAWKMDCSRILCLPI